MNAKVKGFWEKVKGFFVKMNKKTRILLGACGAVILTAVIVAAVLLSRTTYAVLFTGLNTSETSAVVSYLNDNGVSDYKIQGDSVLVPERMQTQLQAQMVLAGYPTSGYMYEFLTENTNNLSTNSERATAERIAIEQKLIAVIRWFPNVRDAQVQIEPGTERNYVYENVTPASAWVTVEMEPGTMLTDGQASAIRNMVAHSAAKLDISNVTLHDTAGNEYGGDTAIGNLKDASAMKLQLEQQTSNKVRNQVLQALGAIYGQDNVKVSVNTVVDVNRRVVENTTYRQPEGSTEHGGLIGSETLFWEIIRDGAEPVGGTVGTTTNSDINVYPDRNPQVNGDEDYTGWQDNIDHKIDTTVEQVEVVAGSISDIRVAVTINQRAANAGAVDADTLRSHVAEAAGIGGAEDSASRVSVLIAPFDDPTLSGSGTITIPGGATVPDWVLYAAAAGMALFLVLLIAVLLLRRSAKKKRLAQEKALQEEMMAAAALEAAQIQAAAPTGGADIMDINTEKSMELRKTVRQFAQNNPEIAAQMVKAWLKGGEDNG